MYTQDDSFVENASDDIRGSIRPHSVGIGAIVDEIHRLVIIGQASHAYAASILDRLRREKLNVAAHQ